MPKSSSTSKNSGRREKKAQPVSLKDLNPEKGLKKVKGGTSPGGNGNRQIKTHFA
jgi:hypothetical protein